MFEHMCCTCERKTGDVTMHYVCSMYGFSINKININAGLTVKNGLVFINMSQCVRLSACLSVVMFEHIYIYIYCYIYIAHVRERQGDLTIYYVCAIYEFAINVNAGLTS